MKAGCGSFSYVTYNLMFPFYSAKFVFVFKSITSQPLHITVLSLLFENLLYMVINGDWVLFSITRPYCFENCPANLDWDDQNLFVMKSRMSINMFC